MQTKKFAYKCENAFKLTTTERRSEMQDADMDVDVDVEWELRLQMEL